MVKSKSKMLNLITDGDVPLEHRRQLLAQLCLDEGEAATAILSKVLNAASAGNSASVCEAKLAELEEARKELEQGPLRSATYVRPLESKGAGRRARVLFEDGSAAVVPMLDDGLANTLQRGDTVLLEAQGKALLFRDPDPPDTGEEARLERILADGRVEVTVRGDERAVYVASAALTGLIEAGEVDAGATLLVCPRRMMAFEALPGGDGLSHYRFLAREPAPNVVIERDVGAPPSYIQELLDIVRQELEQPRLRRRWRLRRCVTRLLAGVSGSGKTLSILALWRGLYELMSEITDVPVDELPPRVMRLRPSEILSKWLGEADKNLDRFFDEAEQLANEAFVTPNGRRFDLPVLVLIEEIDSVGRSRGDEPVYDRILTTALQRLDTTVESLQSKMILFVATTNVAQLVDPALLRRIGGGVERFGRLTRRAFMAVLDKQLAGRPLENTAGCTDADNRRRLVAEVASWLYGPAHTRPNLVELTYAGSTTRVPKNASDFLTAATVDLAVQRAAEAACLQEASANQETALNRATLIAAIEKQIRSTIDQLHEANVHHYVDLPDGVRVASLHRPEQPAIQSYEIERVACNP